LIRYFLCLIQGATRKDWNNPSQTVGNDPQYGKAGSPGDSNNPKRGGN
jgi:hypothetical protein